MTLYHYGWPSSPYSAKTRAALRVSGLEWSETPPHGLTFAWLQARVGRKIIPVIRTSEGEFVQDSSRIIDELERRSGRPMTPRAGLARVLALWVEVFADEWLIYPAMYFRWRYRGGDFDYMVADFGRSALPGLPASIQRMAGREVAEAMSRYLPIMGIDAQTGPAMEAATLELLDRLDRRLARAPFVLGDSPCIADFALQGPLGAHLGRDPWSAPVIDARPRVRAWLDVLARGETSPGPLELAAPLDEGLAELLRPMFTLAGPGWLRAHELAVERWTGPGARVHRRIGEFEASLGLDPVSSGQPAQAHHHKLTAVTVWKMQRPIRALGALGEGERAVVVAALERLGAGSLARLAPLEGYELESIAWDRDATRFGVLSTVVDRLTPLIRRFPPRRPLHPRPRGQVDRLGG